MLPCFPPVARMILVATLATLAMSASGDEPCLTCGDAGFPDAATFLAAHGLATDDYSVLLTWKEVAPASPDVYLAGYHLQPKRGGAPFDVYFDAGGNLLSDGDLQTLGVVAKRWDLAPAATNSEVYKGTADSTEHVPIPSSLGLKAALTRIILPESEVDRWRAEDAAGLSTPAKGVKRIGGFIDLVHPVTVAGSEVSQGAWRSLPDGSMVWAATLHAGGAIGQRIHFAQLAVPPGGRVLLYNSTNPQERYVVEGPGPVWSATCFSEDVVVECLMPPGVPFEDVALAIDRTVYVYAGPGEWNWAKAAGSCNLDVTCHPAWSTTANGVGGLGTIGSTGFLWCTGTLVVDSDPTTDIPYFLTAYHCVSSASEARTIEVYWLYQTSSCNGAVPNPAGVPRTSGGADFLAGTSASAANDFALLRLRNAPPPGITFVGWASGAVSDGTGITGIHHPSGDYKRISFGAVKQSVLSRFTGRPATNYWGVQWSSGVTEPGSSGSPLFESATQRIIGQLWGGYSSCSAPNDPDAYGRFDKTLPVVMQYLGETLRVTSPNGGEEWAHGTTETITWVPSVATVGATVRIELLKNGLIASVLATNKANDGAMNWTIPSNIDPGSNYRIRVASTTNTALIDQSDEEFAIIPAPQITVLSPSDGATWPRGATRPILWTSLGNVGGTVKLELLSGATVVSVIQTSTANDGLYEWTIPTGLAPGLTYSIRVSSTANPIIFGVSPGVFTLSNDPAVSLSNPQGGETWRLGTTQNIQWTSNNGGASVRIELVKAGSVLMALSANEPNDGAFQWAIPEVLTPGTDYRIRIAPTTALQAFDESRADFTLYVGPQLAVVSPNGGERWAQGSQQEVKWTSKGAVGTLVRVELRHHGALTLTLAASTDNDGSVHVDLPTALPLGTAYTVRVISMTDPAVFDDSDAAFSVTNDPVLRVTSPNGGETWQRQLPQDIRWTSRGAAGNLVRLDLLRTSLPGQVVLAIADSTTNDGIFTWTMPQDLQGATDYLIRVASLAVEGLEDRSDAPFAISTCGPAPPQGLSASDGTYPAFVRITWPVVTGATGYRVFRSITDDAGTAEALTGWLTATSYDDTTARLQSSSGCSGGSGVGIMYYYWVQARNICGESAWSASDSGYRGTGGKARIYERVLPSTLRADGTREAFPASLLAIRLRGHDVLDPATLWARLDWPGGSSETVDWAPASFDDATDGWAVYRPTVPWNVGDVVTMTTGIATVAGVSLVPVTFAFTIVDDADAKRDVLWQPADEDLAEAGLGVLQTRADERAFLEWAQDAANATLQGAMSETYRIEPDGVFDAPQWIWIPLPEHTSVQNVIPYYYYNDSLGGGWYRGDRVDGWMIGGGIHADFAGVPHVGYLVRHGGMIVLGPREETPAAGASVAPRPFARDQVGDTVVLLLAVGALVWAGRRMPRRESLSRHNPHSGK